MGGIEARDLRAKLLKVAPSLWADCSALAEQWCVPLFERLEARAARRGLPKTINDPVWGTIELFPWEVDLLDSPLLQRLRGIRQLGMVHLVYPGAGYDRLEHSRGAVEAADRMIRALERNAQNRQEFGDPIDKNIPKISSSDRYITRLAALLHDIGHGPCSHAGEDLLRARHAAEFQATEDVLRESFSGATKVQTSETLAIMIVMSEGMRKVMEHPRFLTGPALTVEPATAIVARILGSPDMLDATYLSGIVSGPIDCDKLDYMARDCYHAGLPLGLDIERVISKLEVVTVTQDNAPNADLRARAERSRDGRFYEIGIALGGLAAYEQMIIARVVLYDRLYYHHKVRSAEAMLRRLISMAESERAATYKLSELMSDFPDDLLVALIGGEVSGPVPSGKDGARRLASSLRQRQIHRRAFAFAARFIDGLAGLDKDEQPDTRAALWMQPNKLLADESERAKLRDEIVARSNSLRSALGEGCKARSPAPEDVEVDLPKNKSVVRGADILTRSHDGQVNTPNLFFDPERWSQAYESQKKCGFVFAAGQTLPLIALASRIVFFERFGLVMNRSADQLTKTADAIPAEWFDAATKAGVCSAECASALQTRESKLLSITVDQVRLPPDWGNEDPDLASRIANGFTTAFPRGLPFKTRQAALDTIEHLLYVVDAFVKGGMWNKVTSLDEKQEMQPEMLRHLRTRAAPVTEAANLNGGQTDLIMHDSIVIENKVVSSPTKDPFSAVPNAPWQERRYAIAVNSRVGFIVVAYKPFDESAVLPLTSCIQVVPLIGAPENRVHVRIVIPWGHQVPSSAKTPPTA